MQMARLAELVESPQVQHRLLGDYAGGYSIGVTSDPACRSKPAIRVHTEGSAALIPDSIVLDGESVTVLSHPDFVSPRPLSARRQG